MVHYTASPCALRATDQIGRKIAKITFTLLYCLKIEKWLFLKDASTKVKKNEFMVFLLCRIVTTACVIKTINMIKKC